MGFLRSRHGSTRRWRFDERAAANTAGVPGRNEIDDTQELRYGPIMQAIAETGYRGYIGQEFVSLRDKVASLGEAVRICDV